MTDNWMEQVIKKSKSAAASSSQRGNDNPYAELDRFFRTEPLSHEECPDIIVWYGVCGSYLSGERLLTLF